jgi:Flp pilus assembly protein protease CpaA
VGGLVFLYPYQKSWLGAGDVKLMMITGGVLGPQAAAITALYAAVIGGIQALLVLFIRRMRQGSSFSKTTDSRIPYALAITLGGYLSVLKPGI